MVGHFVNENKYWTFGTSEGFISPCHKLSRMFAQSNLVSFYGFNLFNWLNNVAHGLFPIYGFSYSFDFMIKISVVWLSDIFLNEVTNFFVFWFFNIQ